MLSFRRAQYRPYCAATIALLSLASALAETAAAQAGPAPGMRLSVAGGIVHHLQADALASPLRYSGLGTGFSLAMVRQNRRSEAGFSVAYARATLKSRLSDPPVSTESTERLSVGVPYLRTVGTWDGLSLRLGGQATADALYRRHGYRGGDEEFLDFFILLDAIGAVDLRLSPMLRIRETASATVGGVAWRPYTGLKQWPQPEPLWPGEILALRNQLALATTLSSRLSGFLAYEVVLLRHTAPWELATAAQRVNVGLEVHLFGSHPGQYVRGDRR